MSERERLGFISDLVLAFLFGVVPMPVAYRWIGWFCCWCGLLYVLQRTIAPVKGLPRKTRICGTVVLSALFIFASKNSAIAMWEEEQAAAQEGNLIGAGPAINDGKPHGFPFLEVGGSTLIMTPNGVPDYFILFPDAGVGIEWGYHGPLFTTTVRDRNGNLVVQVTRNHWHVYPLYSADKNYSRNSLEVEDSAGHVVLQVQVLPQAIKLQGEWWDTQHSGIRFLAPVVRTPDAGAVIERLGPLDQKPNSLIQPMFLYPSKDHWGQRRE